MTIIVKMAFGGIGFCKYILVDPVFSAEGINAKFSSIPDTTQRVTKGYIEEVRNNSVGGLFPFVSNDPNDIFHIVEYKVLP